MNTKNKYMESVAYDHYELFTKLKKIKPDLIKSLNLYTKNAYGIINKSLRENNKLSSSYKKIVNNIDTLFDLVEPITEPITLYRGVKQEEESKSENAFISTSYNIDFVSTTYTDGSNCCLIIINVPVGSKILFVESISNYPFECEVIINRDGSFVIDSIVKGNKNYLENQNIKDYNERLFDRQYNQITKIFVSYVPKLIIKPKTAELLDLINKINSKRIQKNLIEKDFIDKARKSKLFNKNDLLILEDILRYKNCNKVSKMKMEKLVLFLNKCRKIK